MFRTALEKLGVEPSKAVMVGDTFDEDITGAKKMGSKAVLVRRTEEQLTNTNFAPDRIISNLQELIDHLEELLGARQQSTNRKEVPSPFSS